MRRMKRGAAGLTVVEMLAALAIVMILATMAIPIKRWDDKRRREAELRDDLQVLRQAIDRYNEYVQKGMIVQKDVDQMGYPRTIEELAEGVEITDPGASRTRKVIFLQQGIPVDPMTSKAEWGLRSYQDDWGSDAWGGQNVFDVYSLAEGTALDGSKYRDW